MTTAKPEDNANGSEAPRRLIAGRYRTLDQIGHGRLGEIFAATDESYEEIGVARRIAIQIIPESIVGNNKLFNRLNLGYAELRASNHPNIVDYLSIGREGKFGYIVMELLDGTSLRRVLNSEGTLTLDEIRPVIRGVGEALSFLHTKDLIHGNLTTRNVFITDEFDVRLLDVLPVDPAEALVRGITASDPFGRCSVEDDVFGLACLAYEMLSGKHPFNFSSPAEARLAGLKAERIGSIPEREWEALNLALSFDDEQKISTVADFMRELGIQGTERMRPLTEHPNKQKPVVASAMEEPSPFIQPAEPEPMILTATPLEIFDPVSEDEPPYDMWADEGNSSLRAVLLGVLLVGLGVWSYFGQPEERIIDLIGYLDEKMDIGLVQPSDGLIEFSETDPVVPFDQPATAATSEESASALDQPGDDEVSTDAGELTANTDLDQMSTESEALERYFVVSVSEGDGAARITMPRIEPSESPLVWWTSEHTATADKDYISISQQAVDDESFDAGGALYIPLINDSLREPPESFFVNLGRINSAQGPAELVVTIRVDLFDDD